MNDDFTVTMDIHVLHDAFKAFGIAAEEAVQQMTNLVNSLPDEYWEELELLVQFTEMEQKDYESLLEYGQRLQQSGCLDDPDIRWHYTKAVCLAILRRFHHLGRHRHLWDRNLHRQAPEKKRGNL